MYLFGLFNWMGERLCVHLIIYLDGRETMFAFGLFNWKGGRLCAFRLFTWMGWRLFLDSVYLTGWEGDYVCIWFFTLTGGR